MILVTATIMEMGMMMTTMRTKIEKNMMKPKMMITMISLK
jgi:hypothetical protein